jgi:alpha-tubulin suppressor-like RCC1 family protein
VVSAGGEAFGVEFTCVLQTDKTVTCWGDNYAGYGSPCTPPAGTLFSSISTGSLHSCGLKTDNTVACWGDNYYGQATPPAGTFIAVSAGGAQTCGIKAADSTIACWPDQHVVF